MRSEPTLSNLLSATFEQIGESARLIVIYLAVMVPLGTLSLYFERSGGSSDFGFDFGIILTESLFAQGMLAVAVVVGVFVVSLVLYYWLYAAMLRRTASPSFGRILPFLGIYILSALGIGFGFVLLIVPGLILIVRWVAVLPVVLAEDRPAMDSFGDSWEMTRGHFWSILGAIVILFVMAIIVAGIFGGAAIVLGGEGSVGALAIDSLVEQATSTLFVAFAVAAYRLMHHTSEELTEMFE